jgi:hypothetical protein
MIKEYYYQRLLVRVFNRTVFEISKEGRIALKEKKAIYRSLCEAVVLLIVLSSIIFLTACNDNSDICFW